MYTRRWAWIALIVGMATAVNATDYWTNSAFDCGAIKDKLAANEETTDTDSVLRCIFDCFDATAGIAYEVTPTQCFTHLMQPYITKVLKKTLPTDTEMQNCLKAVDRSDCKVTLLYFFAKWYKDHFSASHSKRFARFLFYIWANNPDIVRTDLMGFGFWDHTLGKDLSHIRLNTEQDVQAAIKITSPSDQSQFPVIENEIKRHCYKPPGDNHTTQFCRLRIVINIAKKIRTLAREKATHSEDFQSYVNAINCNFIPFSVLFGESGLASDIAPSTTQEKIVALEQRLNDLAHLTKERDTDKLRTFLHCMPETYLLDKACKQELFPVVARRCCILSEVVGQLLIYSEMSEKRKQTSATKAKTINFSLNLRKVITELRGEEVFKMMLESRYQEISSEEQIAHLIEGKFDQLKNYFIKLQSFNMQKANADVGYIKGMLKYFSGKTQTAISNVETHVGGVLKAALIAQSIEVAQKILKLVATIVEACNPFKAVFNGGTATDLMEATAELATAIADLAHASALRSAWTDVIAAVQNISAGFQDNSEFLSAVGRIVDKIKLTDFPEDDEFKQCRSTFLRLYTAYTPKVDKEMLETLTRKFDTTVETGCELINAVTESVSGSYIAVVKDGLYCQKAAVSTSSLQAIYSEIHDFQFEFIESMAVFLQSATGYQASKKMVTITGRPMAEIHDPTARRKELRANIIMAHTTYEMQKLDAIRSLCDFLEYKEGKTPAVCIGSNTDVPTLLSYIPRRCRSVDSYVSIPITASPNREPGRINLKRLYSGEEISFTIPSYDWMKQQKWIGQDDEVDAVFIRSFEVFLPTISRDKERIKVTVRSLGGNRFHDGGITYSLVPGESFTNIYTGGERFNPCKKNPVENPYSICEDRKLPKLCILSEVRAFDDPNRLYPTALSMFKIKATGVTVSQAPNPRTLLDIKAGISMCILDRNIVRKKRTTVEVKAGCCTGEDFWNVIYSACRPCPSDSRSNLNGYYCEKNPNALFDKKRKKSSSS